MSAGKNQLYLPANTNQARGIAQYAIDFLAQKLGDGPSPAVHERVELFHTDSVVCGVSAVSLCTNAPSVLREEALEYALPEGKKGATVFGNKTRVHPEKAVVANASAVREWDSNGTVFGFNEALQDRKFQAGEFGHNDFYPVVIAACQEKGLDGKTASLGMIAIDEIRGRLCEVFSLKSYKIDHVLHGGIASAAVYGALLGATVDQIECAIGMVVAHYTPWRAIRAGRDLSDSKGASAAVTSEVAVLSVRRAMKGFLGPRDIFRNPQSMFLQRQPSLKSEELASRRNPKVLELAETFEAPIAAGAEEAKVEDGPPNSAFDLVLAHSGDDFALMWMHFKLGLYEHQSAGALQALIDLLYKNADTLLTADGAAAGVADAIKEIRVVAYEPAFGIIGDPAKRDPNTRQSADHSMVFILSRKLRKALQLGSKTLIPSGLDETKTKDAMWQNLILTPEDYSQEAIKDAGTRALMQTIQFSHGGEEYDSKYPEGIPTSIRITTSDGKVLDSGLVMFPSGHARNSIADLKAILDNKFRRLGSLSTDNIEDFLQRLSGLTKKTAAEIDTMYGDMQLKLHEEFKGKL